MSRAKSANSRELLTEKMMALDLFYNPEVSMLRTPFHSPGYHTTLTAESHPAVHRTHTSLQYALGLLDTELPEYEQRAAAIIERVLTLQDRDRNNPTYGIWPWFYEEPLARMAPPDWNWADFCGKELVLTVIRHGHKLPTGLKEQVCESIGDACEAILKRDVGPHYTNIAIMGAFVTLIAGELLGRNDFAEYGLQRLKKLKLFTDELGAFQEYNSPAYSTIAIIELSKIRTYSVSSEARNLASSLLDVVWRMAAEHFHAATGQWSGPHSRSYSTLLTAKIKSFLQTASDGKLHLLPEAELEFEPEWYESGISCPEPLLELFTRAEKRQLEQVYFRHKETGFEKTADTYMTPEYAIGAFREEIMWNQVRGFVGYFANGGETTYLHLRCLHDGYDYCSAVLHTVLDRNRALLGVRFLTNGGDTHPNLDRIDGSITADDFRLRIELGGCLERVQVTSEGAAAEVSVDGMHIRFERLFAAFGAGPASGWSWEISREGERYGLDLVIHTGSRTTIDFNALEEAAFLFSCVIGQAADTEIQVVKEEGLVRARYADSSGEGAARELAVALKPESARN
ncbi:hypothetical protein SAMN02799630_03708 [Paenibacillus sp. UNCCL117]|uniref:hypothetical protein n=1 Tax=unclassified Paenibacillus TaxID=185978 RepID=UPI00088EE662|nr:MULTISPECIES: hypothetical protein [unclassified Paenibacillus]SDD50254.1 hypothetical protein SAMN04488602_10989 [Paenibacillus sp. cl123]SFW49763.1 hypothetical protein SAMN02799630_03708 [Paenibacillus sp. UNCCL117]